MANAIQLNRKYAALPDLDSAPDIYETPDLTDDVSTLPTSTTARSTSPASSYQDAEDEDSPIDHRHLHPDQARSHFGPAQVDARDVDFSDRVSGKRKSYRASSRRRRKGENGTEELGDFSDEEDESLERKLARLRREVEEVKDEVVKRQAQKRDEHQPDGEEGLLDLNKIAALSDVLSGLQMSKNGTKVGAQAGMAQKIGTIARTEGSTSSQQILEPVAQGTQNTSATYTVTYAPSYTKTHALAKAADFDKRLTLLEKALGISSSAFPQLDSTGRPTPAILPTLDTVTRQLSVLSESSAASLDAVSRRVRQLTQEAEKLAEARRAAKAAQDALKTRERNGEATPTGGATGGEASVAAGIEDAEQVAKINALYGTLATIESLSPMLPAVLDRLRSLRAIHADAAMASEALAKVEKRQEEMAEEVKRWREGLEKVEGAMKEGEGLMGSNMKVVEGWVRELEQKIERLGR